MDHLQLPSEKFQYAYAAHEEARKAAITANYGYRAKLKYYSEEGILRKWKELMINAPILLHNALFILFAIADMIISWEMVRDIVNQTQIPEGIEIFAVLTFCLLINAWAAVTAHFIGRGWSREVQDWERWNYIFIKNKSQSPPNLVNNAMHKEVISARYSAIISAAILIGLVGVLIYYRNQIMGALGTDTTNTGDLVDEFSTTSDSSTSSASSVPGLQYVMAYLPLAIIIGELFTGDYLWYSIRAKQKSWSLFFSKRSFLKMKEQAGRHDQLAVQYSEAAQQNNEIIHLTGDLERSHLRFKYRSQQNDDFLDPLDTFKRIAFNVKYQGSGKAVSHAQVFGILPNGAKTGNYQTDEDGRVVIPMNNGQEQLALVSIQNKEYLGPFQTLGEHYIDLPEYISVNGLS